MSAESGDSERKRARAAEASSRYDTRSEAGIHSGSRRDENRFDEPYGGSRSYQPDHRGASSPTRELEREHRQESSSSYRNDPGYSKTGGSPRESERDKYRDRDKSERRSQQGREGTLESNGWGKERITESEDRGRRDSERGRYEDRSFDSDRDRDRERGRERGRESNGKGHESSQRSRGVEEDERVLVDEKGTADRDGNPDRSRGSPGYRDSDSRGAHKAGEGWYAGDQGERYEMYGNGEADGSERGAGTSRPGMYGPDARQTQANPSGDQDYAYPTYPGPAGSDKHTHDPAQPVPAAAPFDPAFHTRPPFPPHPHARVIVRRRLRPRWHPGMPPPPPWTHGFPRDAGAPYARDPALYPPGYPPALPPGPFYPGPGYGAAPLGAPPHATAYPAGPTTRGSPPPPPPPDSPLMASPLSPLQPGTGPAGTAAGAGQEWPSVKTATAGSTAAHAARTKAAPSTKGAHQTDEDPETHQAVRLGLCSVCGSNTEFLCSRCTAVFYCSSNCQFADWAKHKPLCNPL
eukprot:m.99011 g.99011  ORF g.99011 m.99011 type:complete len:520 (-) comp14024_c0_seq4:30-1589(-)